MNEEGRKPYYRIAEIAERTGIPKRTLYEQVKNGTIEALRFGEAVYVPEREASALIRGERVTAKPVEGDDEAK